MIPINVRNIAPECLTLNELKCSMATDVYSCAMTIWEILTKQTPFESMSNEEVFEMKSKSENIDYDVLLKNEALSTEIEEILVGL